MKVKQPSTAEEWQEAVLLAHAVRLIYDCRLYGLIHGGPQINVARCDQLIDAGRKRGIVPTAQAVQDTAVLIALQQNNEDFEGL